MKKVLKISLKPKEKYADLLSKEGIFMDIEVDDKTQNKYNNFLLINSVREKLLNELFEINIKEE
jgi:hypothetical protein